VQGENVPSVTVEKGIVVGQPLPPTVMVHIIPHHRHFA
jgi:hypothetical protein